MIFVFGYHPLTRNEGPVEEKECPNCHNIKHWLLAKRTYFVNLFFIPVIPTKTIYYRECPVCKFRENITNEEFSYSRKLAHLNKEAVNSDMNYEEYKNRLNQIR